MIGQRTPLASRLNANRLKHPPPNPRPAVSRIILFLALFAVALGAVTVVFGLNQGNLTQMRSRYSEVQSDLKRLEAHIIKSDDEKQLIEQLRAEHASLIATSEHATAHRLLGIATALVIVLVDSIVITYFVGTTRWCKEVVTGYHFSPELVSRGNRLKRQTFAWSVVSMLTVVGIVALGGASDAGISPREGTEAWATPHLIAGLGGLALIVWVFYLQWNNLQENYESIRVVMKLVSEARGESDQSSADGE